MTLMPLSVAELFAGVGGFRIGFENTTDSEKRAAFEVIWSNQWEPSTKKQHASEIYTARWDMEVTTDDEFVYQSRSNSSDIHVNKDISTIETDEIPDIDLLCGGFPCQDYSVAKTADKAKGIQGKKGVLWWEIRRIIEEKQPKIVLLENVDRLLKSPTSQRGRDFAVMLATPLVPIMVIGALLLHPVDRLEKVVGAAERLRGAIVIPLSVMLILICAALAANNPSAFIYFDF